MCCLLRKVQRNITILMFTLKYLTIYQECLYRKGLETGVYEFGDCPIKDFYGKNISLHVIVGKNGSGKSSLLDMILRIANNLGAIVLKNAPRNAAEDLSYILGLHATLAFEIEMNHSQTLVEVHCHDRAMWLVVDGRAYWLSDELLLGHQPNVDEYFTKCLDSVDNVPDRVECFNSTRLRQIQFIADRFFYTVASNYSMLGFLSPDYSEERAITYRELIDNTGRGTGTFRWQTNTNWINSLFHKNDGYMCPIVLNPYRNDAKIDMENETNLTVQRLAALFICAEADKPLIPDYGLDGIVYQYQDNFIHQFKQARGGKSKQQLKDEFVECATQEGYYAKTILDVLECSVDKDQHPLLNVLALYIVQKVLNIAETYPLYVERFLGVGGIDRTFLIFEKDSHYIATAELATFVRDHNSHIELKVHQARNFYRWAKRNPDGLEVLANNFNYHTYREMLDIPHYQISQLADCMLTLPPVIFKQQIYLKKKLPTGEWLSTIPLWKLSSGERQLVYQLSTIIYHLHNLRSVNPASLRYHNVNIILDEIEICYHPDYQRMFIKGLIDLLTAQGFNNYIQLHILITTHSPFVLSDVLPSQILYLRDGHQLKGQELLGIRSPFAANVNDTLQQSFFLESGFSGAKAQEMIYSLINHLDGSKTNDEFWTAENIEHFIASVGDPLISFQLTKLYAQFKRVNNLGYREWLEQELAKLN